MDQNHPDQSMTPPDAVGLSAATIVADLQQRCEKLRDWHIEAEDRLRQDRQQLEQREQEVDGRHEANDQRSRELDGRDEALNRREQELNDRQSQLDERGRETEAHEQRVQRLEAELRDQQAELKRMRGELDEEWTSVNRVRRAQEGLVEALEADRQRVNELRYKVGPTDQHDAQDQESRLAA